MPPEPMRRGPVVVDIAGTSLLPAERERLCHPLVGGVILFARNYESPAQLRALTADVRALRDPALLVCVDHEGGRVQRFRDGFTVLPSMHELGERWNGDPAGACREAARVGWTIAGELGAHGVDFSFAPVLDLDHGSSAVIGTRAFHRDPRAVTALATALCEGLHAGGMASVGKHFPGHGWVRADSHVDLPVDTRTWQAIEGDDLLPFAALAGSCLDAVMPAHVVYPDVDERPAGFSSVWLQQVLRARLAFDGMIFSDDLGMAGAHAVGDIAARADAAISAGCDVVLVCNDPAAADRLLAGWRPPIQVRAPMLARRWTRMERRAAGACPG